MSIININKKIESKPHYFYPVRLLIEFYNDGKLPDVHSIIIEPEYGRVGHIRYKDGFVRFINGSGLGINEHGSSFVAKDKGYTKYFLNCMGYKTPIGKVFLMPKCIKMIDKNLSFFGFQKYSSVNEIYSYIEKNIKYPCFIKPNNGAKGIGVYKCYDHADVLSVVEEYENEGINTFIVEQFVDLPIYRVDIIGNYNICCYLRKPLSVTGDGKKTIKELLLQKKDIFDKNKRPAIIKIDDPRISKNLKRMRLTFNNVLSKNKVLALHDFSNLPTGGDAYDLTEKIHPYWKKLCVKIARNMGLLLCGIDICCEDILNPKSKYFILEINDSPGLENYAALGKKQAEIVRNLYMSLFNERRVTHENIFNIIKKIKNSIYYCNF